MNAVRQSRAMFAIKHENYSLRGNKFNVLKDIGITKKEKAVSNPETASSYTIHTTEGALPVCSYILLERSFMIFMLTSKGKMHASPRGMMVIPAKTSSFPMVHTKRESKTQSDSIFFFISKW